MRTKKLLIKKSIYKKECFVFRLFVNVIVFVLRKKKKTTKILTNGAFIIH